jgi:polyphenol oxidase
LITPVLSSDLTTSTVWQWHEWQGLPYLKCSLLDNWQHGFFSQHFAPRLPEEIARVFAGDTSVYRLKQVHGNTVLSPAEVEAIAVDRTDSHNLAEADGLVSDRPLQSVWVASADCNPVLIADTASNRVAAVHAGWRGTALRIVPAAIERAIALGSSLENLRIAIGPAIAGEVYQVTERTAAEVGRSILPNAADIEPDDTEAVLATMRQIPNSPLQEDSQAGRVRLDVRRVNQLQLEGLGISPANIAVSPHCTYQQPEYFFSYRRNPEKKVQWSGIVSG